MAEGRVVDEIVDRDGAVQGKVDDDEGSTKEAREDVFVEQPVARFQHVDPELPVVMIGRDGVAG